MGRPTVALQGRIVRPAAASPGQHARAVGLISDPVAPPSLVPVLLPVPVVVALPGGQLRDGAKASNTQDRGQGVTPSDPGSQHLP